MCVIIQCCLKLLFFSLRFRLNIAHSLTGHKQISYLSKCAKLPIYWSVHGVCKATRHSGAKFKVCS